MFLGRAPSDPIGAGRWRAGVEAMRAKVRDAAAAKKQKQQAKAQPAKRRADGDGQQQQQQQGGGGSGAGTKPPGGKRRKLAQAAADPRQRQLSFAAARPSHGAVPEVSESAEQSSGLGIAPGHWEGQREETVQEQARKGQQQQEQEQQQEQQQEQGREGEPAPDHMVSLFA